MKDPLKADQRRKKLEEIIAEKGVWNLNKSQLGKQFNVSDVTIAKDIKKILSNVPEQSIDEIVYEIKRYFKENFAFSRKLVRSDNENISSKGVMCLNATIKSFTDFLEAYGKKPITPQQLDFKAELPEIKLITVAGIEGLRENIELFAKQQELSIFDFLVKIFPDEVSNTNVVKKWLNEEEEEKT